MNTSPWTPNAQVGEYRLLEQLGAGAMGAVWRVEHLPTGATRALKTTLAEQGESVQRFEREARALADLEHPNVTRVHTAGVVQGRHYLVMDLAPGGDLAARLKAGPLDPEQARLVVRDLSRGLAHVHSRGLLHRDLKPSNVLFADDGRPMLVDFGLTRRIDGSSLTQSGSVLGTPSYMSPEQAEGEKHVDERTDVYGLGAVLYHALTGQPPFTGSSLLAVLREVIGTPPRPPSQLNPAVPPGLEAVCLKALAKDPEQRYPSARALAAALEAPPAPASRTPRMLVAVAPVVAVVSLVAFFVATRNTPPVDSAGAAAVRPPPAETPVEIVETEPPPEEGRPEPERHALDLFMEDEIGPPQLAELDTPYARTLYDHSGDGINITFARNHLLRQGKPARAAAWVYHAARGPNRGMLPTGWKVLGDLLKEEAHRDVLFPADTWAKQGGSLILECYLRGARAKHHRAMLSAADLYIHPRYPGLEANPAEGLRWLRVVFEEAKPTELLAEAHLYLTSLVVYHPHAANRPADEEGIASADFYLEYGTLEAAREHAQRMKETLQQRIAEKSGE